MEKNNEYLEILQNACVVPSCYTKKVYGRTVALWGQELENDKSIHGESVKKQSESLANLKAKRLDIQELRKNEGQYSEIEELVESYNNIRYNKSKPSETLTKWNQSFIKYLETIEYCDPRRGCNMALRILQPHEIEKVFNI